MKPLPRHPVIYETNTWVLPDALGRKYRKWLLNDVLLGESFERSGNDMRDAGLYFELGPWECHLFQVRAV